MRIAVASEGLDVSPRFGRCASFTCYTIEYGIITECQNMPNLFQGARQAAAALRELRVSVLIASAMDRDERAAMNEFGIEVEPGRSGSARAAAEAYLALTLAGDDECLDEAFDQTAALT